MKNKFYLVLSILFVMMILAACGNDDENSHTSVSTNESDHTDELSADMVRITVSLNNGEQFINEQEVEVEEGENLLEVLESTFFVETNEDDVVTSIERMQVDEEESTSWVLFINDEETDTLAKDYSINGGEKITFDLQ